MQKRRLGASDLEITPIGVGAWAMGGAGWQFAWGPQDDDESIAAIHAALDQGNRLDWLNSGLEWGLLAGGGMLLLAFFVHEAITPVRC